MKCLVCGNKMQYCEQVKIQSLRSTGLFNIDQAEMRDKYRCDTCGHVAFETLEKRDDK